MSKKWILACLSFFFGTAAFAQEVFKTRILNKEYDVFMQINLYEENVKIPGQDILGETFGYLKKNTDSRVWAITGVEISKDGKKATLEMVNDYGSEDLTAELTMQDDGTYMLKQVEGSTIKVTGKGKWIKLPKNLVFNKQ